MDRNTPGGGIATDYAWNYDPKFPIANLGEHDWQSYYDEWQPIYANDLGYDRFGEMLKYVQSHPDDPIVCVQWSDGNYYLWDGWHRSTCCAILGKLTFPAIVGKPKWT